MSQNLEQIHVPFRSVGVYFRGTVSVMLKEKKRGKGRRREKFNSKIYISSFSQIICCQVLFSTFNAIISQPLKKGSRVQAKYWIGACIGVRCAVFSIATNDTGRDKCWNEEQCKNKEKEEIWPRPNKNTKDLILRSQLKFAIS